MKPEDLDEHKAKLVAEFLNVPTDTGGSPPIQFKEPDKCAKALEMRAHGSTFQDITKETGMMRDTLRKIFRAKPEILEKMKLAAAVDHLALAEGWNNLQFMKIERVMNNPDLLDDITPQQLALAAGINNDKAMANSGQASVVIEHRRGVTFEDAQAAINAARAAVRKEAVTVEAEVIGDD